MSPNHLIVGTCVNPTIDVAVIDVSLNPIYTINDVSAHLVILDPIDISSDVFHSIFYDSSGSFAVNPRYKHVEAVAPLVAINHPYRTVDDGENFCLLDVIFDFIEYDLNVCRTAFTPCTNIALNKQLLGLKTFYDLGIIKLQCSLDWNSIIESINCELHNHHHDDHYPCLNSSHFPAGYTVTHTGNHQDRNITIDLVISIAFTSPTVGVLPTIIKLIYRAEFPIDWSVPNRPRVS